MTTTILIVLATNLFAQAPVQESRECRVRVDVADGSTFTGKTELPATIVVKSKFGDVTVESASILSITRNPDKKWTVALADSNKIVGDCTLGAIALQITGGKITITQEDLRTLVIQRDAPAVVRPPPPAATPPPAAKPAPAFPGVEYRKAAEDYMNRIPYAPAILLSTRKHVALLDQAQEECVFYEIETGTLARVKTEAKPVNLVEKNGKVYVANNGTNSLTVIDARTLQLRGRVALGTAPLWVAAPARGDVLYFASRETNGGVQAVDTKKDTLLGPLTPKNGKGGITGWHLAFVSVSPDNRLLITQSGTGSPGCRPDLYLLDGLHYSQLWQPGVELHTDHPGPFHPDPSGRRFYCGYRVYSSDMRQSVGSPPCAITVPHPTLKLVFGSKKGTYWSSTSETLVLLDEDKLTVLKEIPFGDTILNLVPTDKRLLVVGPKTLYPIDLAKILPEGTVAISSKEPLDISQEIDPASIKKASDLIQAAQKDLDARKFDDARKKFEEADKTDPFSNGRVGLAMLLVKEEKFGEAIEYIGSLLGYPFRSDADFPILYNQMAIAFARSNQQPKAIETFQRGLQQDPRNTMLLKNLGAAYENMGEEKQAYVYLSRSLKIDPKQADAKKMLDDLSAKIRKSTTGVCPNCDGDGKFEAIIEEAGAARRKIIKTCAICKGGGRTWKRPCEECMGSGQKGYNEYCEACMGRGVVLEAAPK
jgi:YVTN family beta-propeller protein